jgi:molybdopterin/thiamine biosynthesis adenylyltransferase
MIEFTEERLERYSRHILLQDIGVEGQIKLAEAKVLIVGAGGLGSPAALYLAAAGVGKLGIADADAVDLSNLQRQIIHFTPDLGKPKVVSAAEKIRALNPDVEVVTYHEFLRAANIRDILRGYDFVIDGTDNFAAKFLINDACVLEGIPLSHGGILRFNGQTMTILPRKSACYRCAFKAPPPAGLVPTCSEAGILGAVAGMLGTIQAAEALKFITGVGELLTDKLLVFDAKNMDFSKVRFKPNPRCAVCGENASIHQLVDEEQPVCELRPAAAAVGAKGVTC